MRGSVLANADGAEEAAAAASAQHSRGPAAAAHRRVAAARAALAVADHELEQRQMAVHEATCEVYVGRENLREALVEAAHDCGCCRGCLLLRRRLDEGAHARAAAARLVAR